MENATKALLIAGGVLIAILILSAGIYLYVLFSNQSEEYSQVISAVEIQKFNSKFDVYLGRENITAQEIVSVVNLAREYNNQITIIINNTPFQFNSVNTQENFIKECLKQEKTFKCKLITSGAYQNPVYDKNGKIVILRFQ